MFHHLNLVKNVCTMTWKHKGTPLNKGTEQLKCRAWMRCCRWLPSSCDLWIVNPLSFCTFSSPSGRGWCARLLCHFPSEWQKEILCRLQRCQRLFAGDGCYPGRKPPTSPGPYLLGFRSGGRSSGIRVRPYISCQVGKPPQVLNNSGCNVCNNVLCILN